ncbi:hypothetical protein EZY14_009260 [Kordia sp. TARA_039_SRF]|nr:hypothetical protein EZY14_009260 [Kordia sp. TARA_039_SRF]
MIDSITLNLYKGKLKPKDLHKDLLWKTYDALDKAAADGFGDDWTDESFSETVEKIQDNLYRFSGAKTYQQLKEMNSFLVDDNGKIRTYNDFKRKVFAVHQNYNKRYLDVEYQTAVRSSQAVRQWQDFQANKDLFPNLKYYTIDDERVRDDHKPLHQVIKPVDDPFWNTYYPPNGYGCRCYVESTEDEPTNRKIKTEIREEFSYNVGKTKEVFNQKKHPYFSIPKKENIKLSKWKKNLKKQP